MGLLYRPPSFESNLELVVGLEEMIDFFSFGLAARLLRLAKHVGQVGLLP